MLTCIIAKRTAPRIRSIVRRFPHKILSMHFNRCHNSHPLILRFVSEGAVFLHDYELGIDLLFCMLAVPVFCKEAGRKVVAIYDVGRPAV